MSCGVLLEHVRGRREEEGEGRRWEKMGGREEGEGRRGKGEVRREKGEGRREKGGHIRVDLLYIDQ
jgi:hypothetical protein